MAEIRIRSCSVEQDSDRWPTFSQAKLVDVIAWFTSKLEEIPVEYRGDAECEIDSINDWHGGHLARIEITYVREEDAFENAQRMKAAQRVREIEIANARRLLAQYGEDPR